MEEEKEAESERGDLFLLGALSFQLKLKRRMKSGVGIRQEKGDNQRFSGA